VIRIRCSIAVSCRAPPPISPAARSSPVRQFIVPLSPAANELRRS
jgi:hypothetical protein